MTRSTFGLSEATFVVAASCQTTRSPRCCLRTRHPDVVSDRRKAAVNAPWNGIDGVYLPAEYPTDAERVWIHSSYSMVARLLDGNTAVPARSSAGDRHDALRSTDQTRALDKRKPNCKKHAPTTAQTGNALILFPPPPPRRHRFCSALIDRRSTAPLGARLLSGHLSLRATGWMGRGTRLPRGFAGRIRQRSPACCSRL